MNEVELTQELIRLNSENPPGNEKEIAKFIFDYLNDLKIESEMMEFEKNRCNVIGVIGKKEGLMLNGHLDTVPAGDLKNWKYDPFSGKIVRGKLYGRGASDMKGGIACMLSATKDLSREKFKRKLLLAFVSDEEVGFKGSLYLINKKRNLLTDIKYGVIGEPQKMNIGIANKGILEIRIKFSGKSAHASTPWLGDNAILKATKFIEKIVESSRKSKIQDPILGKETINVGMIKGGAKVNMVPEFCELEIDQRIIKDRKPQICLGRIKSLTKRFDKKAKIEIINNKPPFKISKNSGIVKLIQKIAKTKLVASTGYNEAGLYYTNCGIECVAFGPGNPETAHAANEFIEISNLRRGKIIYEKLIRKWCL